jgi:4-amino-4-deoxy-L-arabinose transferase-like glycosyltransferase
MHPPASTPTLPSVTPRRFPLWAQALLVLAIASAVYLPGLNLAGLSMSEGFRVFPGWTILRGGDPLVLELFDQPYLRKPPGMPWAVACASWVLGETPAAARSVAALATILGCLLTFAFATRWMGAPWGMMAGIAHALTPLFWYPGRAAEIEAPHHLFVQAACLFTIHLLVMHARRRALAATLLGVSVFGMFLFKGPSAVPCLVGALLASAILTRSWRTLLAPGWWLATLLGIAAFGAILLATAWRVVVLNVTPVLQTPEEFLWRSDKLDRIALLPLESIAAALPLSVALISCLVRPPGVREWLETSEGVTARRALLAVVLAFVLSILIYTLMGVSNNRYTMPAATFLAPALAYTLRTARLLRTPILVRLVTLSGITRPWIWAAVLLVGAGVALAAKEQQRQRASGVACGEALAAILPDHAILYADGLIDTRPELLWAARDAAAQRGRSLHVRWVPISIRGPKLPPPGHFLALMHQTDAELAAYAHALPACTPIFRGRVHKFTFTVYQVRDDTSPEQAAPIVRFPSDDPTLGTATP